jgi:hypothetical protein
MNQSSSHLRRGIYLSSRSKSNDRLTDDYPHHQSRKVDSNVLHTTTVLELATLLVWTSIERITVVLLYCSVLLSMPLRCDGRKTTSLFCLIFDFVLVQVATSTVVVQCTNIYSTVYASKICFTCAYYRSSISLEVKITCYEYV